MVNLKYLRIPESRIYEISDVFTRIDELLVQVVTGLDMVIDLLYNIAQRYGYQEISITPTAQPVRRVENPLFISGVKDIDTVVVDAPATDYKKIDLYGNGAVITADDKILIAGKPNAPGFPLYGNTYIMITRSPDLSCIYIKSGTGSAVKTYIMFLK